MKTPKKKPGLIIATQHRVMTREFSNFFHEMLRVEPGWVDVTDEQFIDALAAPLIRTGERSGREFALLQTLVYELQDRLDGRQAAAGTK